MVRWTACEWARWFSPMDDMGILVCGSRWMKSKMPWAAGIHAGSHGRPGNRTLRWNRRTETPEVTGLPQPIQIRQHVPMLFQEYGVHAVNPQHDHFLAARGMGRIVRAPGQQNGERRQCKPCNQAATSLATRAPSARRTAFPSMCEGTLIPNSSSAVGAMSSMPGSSASILRFENRTPGTRCGSTQ